MHKFLIAVCLLATIFDGFAAMLGLCIAVRAKMPISYGLSAMGALIIVALLLTSQDIWRREENTYRIMIFFWILGFVLNSVAVFFAFANHILLSKSLNDSVSFTMNEFRSETELPQRVIIIVLTAFLTAAPIAVSYLWKSFYDEDDDNTPEKRRRPPPLPKI